ncbi:MAG TPA: glucokinase [Burkholderiaceae bacterium]|jgi:glucokinase|nr:glucokinase [Burkholderiaceae bacterium]
MSVASSSPKFPRLVGDVGGTNARFALQAAPDEAAQRIVTYAVAEHATIDEAILAYLATLPEPRPRQGAIGIANPVVGDWVKMTNAPWAFSTEAVRKEIGFDRFLVINDFTALALSLAALAPEDLHQVGGGQADPLAAVGLLGAGTGLGVSGLVRVDDGRRSIPIQGEGGHVSLAPVGDREYAVVAQLQRRYGHASAERALSGPGLVNLYDALCEIDGVPARDLDPAAVSTAGEEGTDPRCVEALALFLAWLGSVAGDLALTLGARGGVYIGGGIVPRLGDRIDQSAFRERFVAKGRFRTYLEAIPTWVVDAKTSPALIGAGRALDEL